MDSNDFKDYKEVFIQSAQKNLQTLTDSLSKLQLSPSDPGVINTAFIAAHSLRGECFAMGFLSTSSACEKIERLFLQLKNMDGSASPELLSTIGQALPQIQASLRLVKESDKEN